MSDLDQVITGYRVWHCRLPVRSKRSHGIGTVSDACEVVLLRLTLEDGTEGWGEAAAWSVFTGSPEASFAALDRYIRPLVEGRKLSDRPALMAQARRAVAHCTEAKAALESALLDLEGRVRGLPVARLLGPDPKSSVPLSVSIADPDFDQDIRLLERLTADGVGIVKLKTGFRDHAFDLRRLEHLRTHFPALDVRVDYNQGLTADEALAQVPEVARFAPTFIEQPVAFHDYDTMARLRGLTDIPLLADESVFGPEDMARAIREGICDGVSVKVMKSGGPVRGAEVARMAAEAGLSAYGGDMFESGLGHLPGLHMVAACPEITLGCEFYQARYYLVEDLLDGEIELKDGALVLPTGPGLGLCPDPDRVAAAEWTKR
ncbi:enolase C-terminal domain-like protein [Ovoidimarina sediminis]|uniref:enolase C-terminal domain-like protein n=1 Tax=Ovoidimarina sediminis TaxID=3079856 RepID=UPI002906AF0C|nr:enolase C-terminal domain-like protein [Rhodophyticola sp. MJ-SS7]MDU8942496.1 enolase C-terminal domain-like protein [Rhodophyticola sp. MJ-SS7]